MNKYYVEIVMKDGKKFDTIGRAASITLAATKGVSELLVVYDVKLADVADLHVTLVVL